MIALWMRKFTNFWWRDKSVKKMEKIIELLRNKEYKNELICDQK